MARLAAPYPKAGSLRLVCRPANGSALLSRSTDDVFGQEKRTALIRTWLPDTRMGPVRPLAGRGELTGTCPKLLEEFESLQIFPSNPSSPRTVCAARVTRSRQFLLSGIGIISLRHRAWPPAVPSRPAGARYVSGDLVQDGVDVGEPLLRLHHNHAGADRPFKACPRTCALGVARNFSDRLPRLSSARISISRVRRTTKVEEDATT